ncbi:MAG: DUF1549 domain-containing protein, partial [Verrucomicrobiales bacterium]|nr:DUF1549 domain-containing protein [Verrucomicrobiales bacterium]
MTVLVGTVRRVGGMRVFCTCLALFVGEAGVVSAGSGGIDWDEARDFWAYRVPEKGELPEVRNGGWVRNEIDRFVLAKLEQSGLSPSAEAGVSALRRRTGYDLTGLPNGSGSGSGSYEDEVERLLGSKAFGERMASMWLGVVRYAEDQAHQVGKDSKFFYPNAYRYRDWVIDAFNRDLGYDEFLKLQIAGDLYGAGDDDLPALGFIGLGPKYYNRGRLPVQAEEWEDRVDVFSRGLLGLTVACARCHD